MAKNKQNTKALVQSKRTRRQWLTFVRMIRYGINNFSRNAWLTVAATAVMTITLLIIFVTVTSRQVLLDSVDDAQRKVDLSLYLKGDTPDSAARQIVSDLEALPDVVAVSYSSASEVRADFAERNKDNSEALSALNTANNRFFASVRVNLKNINDTSQLVNFEKTNNTYKKYKDPNRESSFSGKRRDIINNLASWADLAQKIGIGASVIFIAISSLIVFNTIRMAIFNRKDEIEMMKLIGANKGFIRGPFMIEAIVYGLIAGVLATILGLVIFRVVGPGLVDYGVSAAPTLDFVTKYMPVVMLGMVVLGALIGAVSSVLATRRYLKI